MKALILKDLYVAFAKQKLLLVLPFVFLLMGIWDGNNFLMITYATVFTAMLPLNLISIDESEKWNTYCGTLPVTKGQYVSAKYILSILATAAAVILTALVETIWLVATQAFEPESYVSLIISVVILGTLMPAIQLPFVFRFGAEKGRILFLAVYFTIAFSYTYVVENTPLLSVLASVNIPLLLVAMAAFYGSSWLISIRMYQARTK